MIASFLYFPNDQLIILAMIKQEALEERVYGPNQLFTIGLVTDLGKDGVHFRYGDPTRGELLRGTADLRFTPSTLREGDEVVMTFPDAGPEVIETVFRDTHQVYPHPEPNQLFTIERVTELPEGIRFRYGNPTHKGDITDPRFTQATLYPGDRVIMTYSDGSPKVGTVFRETLQVYPPHPDPNMQKATERVAWSIRTTRLGK